MTTYTTTEAATILNVTPRRVVALIRAGRLRAVKHGRDWMIDADAINAVRDRQPGRPPISE